MKEHKSFLTYKIRASFLIVLILVLLPLTITGILSLERKVQKTYLYASAMRMATEIKYIQIQAIIRGKDYLILVSENNTRFKVIDLTTDEVIYEESPFFENINIYFEKKIMVSSSGNFKNESKITLSRRNNYAFIHLFIDGSVVVKEE